MPRSSVIVAAKGWDYAAEVLSAKLGLRIVTVERKVFRGGEQYHRINVADAYDLVGHNVLYVGSTHPDETFLEMLKVCDALVSVAKIAKLVVVVPFLGYSTMDRRRYPIEIISAKVNAKILSRMLARSNDFLLMLDLHTEGLASYFEGLHDAEPLSALSVLTQGARELNLNPGELVVASADLGRPKAIKAYAKAFGARMALIDKDRDFEEVSAGPVIGNVRGKTVLMCDDMLRSGDTAIGAAEAYLAQGALSVDLAVTHLALNDESVVAMLEASPIRRIVATNSHPMSQHPRVQANPEKFIIKDVFDVFTQPIQKIIGA